MAIASSLSPSKSFLERFRSPVFIASALSLGAHGILFAAMPMLSASEDLQEQEESVPVVALSDEESQRLPDAVRGDRASDFPADFFGNAPLATQDGDSLLPVPGIPPYGDLSGLESSFDGSLQASPSPLWGNPVDIFQGSLPAIPGETSVIFPETNGFDSFGSDSFELPFGDSTIFDDSETLNETSPTVGNEPELDLGELDPGELDNSDGSVAAGDEPLIRGSDEPPGSGLESPLVAAAGGTSIDNAFGGGSEGSDDALQEPIDPDSLAQEQLPAGSSEGAEPNETPESAPPTLDSQDPMMVAFREKQQLFRSYTNNELGLADGGQVAQDVGQIVADQGVPLQLTQQALTVQYPNPDFRCPADAEPALFTLVTSQDGSIARPQRMQSTQYPALDEAAEDAAATLAQTLTTPGVYQLKVEFQDDAGSCVSSDPIS